MYGTPDLKKFSQLYNAVTDVDSVDIDSPFTIRSGKSKIRNPANTFSVSFVCAAIAANRIATVPLLTTDDTFVFQALIQTLSNKILNGVTMADGTNIILSETTGTKIGTATTQKLGFFNATPIVQPAANPDTSGAVLADLETEVNELKALLRSLGFLSP